jgi:hypothetical protein
MTYFCNVFEDACDFCVNSCAVGRAFQEDGAQQGVNLRLQRLVTLARRQPQQHTVQQS